MENIKAGDNVLVIWNKDDQSSISELVEKLKEIVQNGSVVLENSEMIGESKFLCDFVVFVTLIIK